MNKWLIGGIIALVIVVGVFFALSSPNDTNSSNGTAAPESVTSFAAVEEAVAAGGQLIDVRTPQEYQDGHIKGASNLSLQAIQSGTLPSGSKDQKLFVYCHSGNRSSQATAILRKAGYSNITDLGAMTHVESMGGKVIINQ